MKNSVQLTPITVQGRPSLEQARIPSLILLFAFAFSVLSPRAQAVTPPPDGGYAGFNTAEGNNALFSLTTGIWNTAIGGYALFSDTTGNSNTAVGTNALRYNSTGSQNTATGVYTLFNNTTGFFNVAIGFQALLHNVSGHENTATGHNALYSNTSGDNNTATGDSALFSNASGFSNTATGDAALANNTAGNANVAIGVQALSSNSTGSGNVAVGVSALEAKSTGSNNIAIGNGAGLNLTAGDNNIEIGSIGAIGDANTIRIGSGQNKAFVAGIWGATTENAAIPVMVDPAGQLGTVSSSRRFKDEIKPMDQSSNAILGLRPVTFHYKSDSKGTPQFGLIAEDVAKVNPDLVVRDNHGEIYTVRYEAINAMLLNEFLKEHRKVEEQTAHIQTQDGKIADLKGTLVKLQSALEKQAVQLQKISARIETNQPTTRVARE